ncbi:intermediate filament protein [Sesbania bispinosa]|nr:intermediate filament protein [Sesbania bispinosa]
MGEISRLSRFEMKVDTLTEKVEAIENTCSIILHTVRSLDILMRKEKSTPKIIEVPENMSSKGKSSIKRQKVSPRKQDEGNEKTNIIFDVSNDDDHQNPTSSYRSAKKRGASLPPTGKPPFATTGHKTRVKVEEDSFAWQYNPCRSEY